MYKIIGVILFIILALVLIWYFRDTKKHDYIKRENYLIDDFLLKG